MIDNESKSKKSADSENQKESDLIQCLMPGSSLLKKMTVICTSSLFNDTPSK